MGASQKKQQSVEKEATSASATNQPENSQFFTVVTLVGGKRVNKNKLKLLSSLRRCITSIMPLPPPQEEKNL